MILAVNIGNTNINLGLYAVNVLKKCFRVTIADFLDDKGLIKEFCDKVYLNSVDETVTASVNPDIEALFSSWLKDSYGKVPERIGIDIPTRIQMKVDHPEKVGVDRILNSIAAYAIVKDSVIVVDVGTAITFDVVSEAGDYLGGVIAPGMKMCAEALKIKTAQLPLVEVSKPATVVGKNTEQAMISGIYWGCSGSVKFILEKLFDELKNRPPVIATGGDVELIHDSKKYISKVVPKLTLDGIKILYNENLKHC